MILVLMILIPCSLVGLAVYAVMSRWELSDPAPYGSGDGSGGGRTWSGARSLPRLTFRETALDWPVPQFQRLHPGVLLAISVVMAVWVVVWIVVFFVGLSMLHA